jgi:hypothetical protein
MSLKSANQPAGMSVRTVVVIVVVLLLLLVASVGGVFFWLKGDKLRIEKEKMVAVQAREQAELARIRSEDAAKLVLARTRQEEALAIVRNGTNVLGNLLVSVRSMSAEAASFRTNELGRKLAAFPDLVGRARHLLDTEFRLLPSESETITRLENARRIELDLTGKLGGTYEPAADLVSANHTAVAWAEEAQRRVSLAQASLTALANEARIKVVSGEPSVLTLDEAMRQLSTTEVVTQQKTREETLNASRTEAATQTTSALVSTIKTEAEIRAAEMAQKNREDKARVAREIQEREAKERLAKIKTELGVGAIDDEAQRLVLKRKAESPEIQAELAPFITAGNLTAKGRISLENQPISYSELKSMGALEPTPAGIQKMVNVAYTSRDKVRPRWEFKQRTSQSWKHVPADMERVKAAQALLIELGPVMVEMGQLAP